MSKGIVLAGGSGSRLHPTTRAVTKQLLPIYDKPMIYYPISTLMLAGVTEFLIISAPRDIEAYHTLLGDGSKIGVSFSYEVQEEPKGIAEAFIIGKDFIGYDDNVWLILGDNLFFGHNLPDMMVTNSHRGGATVFGYYVSDPRRYGVVEFDGNKVVSIEEKPKHPKSSYAVVGLYHYPNTVIEAAEALEPSNRGELEITDLNNEYLAMGNLHVNLLGRGIAWLDTGTNDSLLEAAHFVQTLQKRTGLMIGCIEEIAYHKGWIDKSKLLQLGYEMKSTSYGQYLMELVNERNILFP